MSSPLLSPCCQCCHCHHFSFGAVPLYALHTSVQRECRNVCVHFSKRACDLFMFSMSICAYVFCKCVHVSCLLDSLSLQAYGETTTHTLSDLQCVCVSVSVCLCPDVNKIGLVGRLNGLVLVCAQG